MLSSVVLGADVGAVTYGATPSLGAALCLGTAGGVLLLAVTARYQWAGWCRASASPPRALPADSPYRQ